VDSAQRTDFDASAELFSWWLCDPQGKEAGDCFAKGFHFYK
jgi:hypothetical protein